MVARHSAGLSMLGTPVPTAVFTVQEATAICRDADVNADYRVSMLDALKIAQYVVGLTTIGCIDETLLCLDFASGGPTDYEKAQFWGCLSQFGFTAADFNRTYCNPCGYIPGQPYTLCQPAATWPPFIPNLGSGNGCSALGMSGSFGAGDCFGGGLSPTQITGINPSGGFVSDKDCDRWTDSLENCVDNSLGFTLMDQGTVTPAAMFSCWYNSGSPGEFIMCRNF
ncbi:MAG: hypothetical protein A3F16_02975 [Deltaproteobacteria bacterium RIFCSPHIGHO2_12_FULL_43_9]|nr:MAG: hypothetical protein A3F16_02975 [Deltaproteobacteria bacterium RIFCSPHIGHO2_12_FULL_43_9]